MSAATFDELDRSFDGAKNASESYAREAIMQKRASKTMLWLGIVAMTMAFAGLTSAYIVSMGEGDWVFFDLPSAFFTSTAIIVVSSFTLGLSYFAARKDNHSGVLIGLLATLALGIGFVVFQLIGYGQLNEMNIFFTGVDANGQKVPVSGSYLFLISALHLAHLFAGLVVLIWTSVQAIRKKYDSQHLHGLQLTSIFWHFLGVLWVYLLLFFLFIR